MTIPTCNRVALTNNDPVAESALRASNDHRHRSLDISQNGMRSPDPFDPDQLWNTIFENLKLHARITSSTPS
jgi:hypothetical protein